MSETQNQEPISLADIAGISLDDVQEFRGGRLPQSALAFRITDGKLDMRPAREAGKQDTPVVNFECEVINVISILPVPASKGATPTPEEVIGMKAFQSFALNDAQNIGRFKAFCTDLGLVGKLTVEQAIEALKGAMFTAKVKHVRNPNDPDEPFTRLKDFKAVQAG